LTFRTVSSQTITMMMQIGNALMDDETDQTGMIEYAWDHAVISDRVYADVKAHCDFRIENATNACNKALDEYFAVYHLIDMYSLYTPVCTDASLSSFRRSKKVGVHGAAPKIFSKHVHTNSPSPSRLLQRHRCGSTASLFLLRVAAWVVHEAGRLRPLQQRLLRGLLQPARCPGGAARKRDQDGL
jgi:hypothetical protein